MSALRLSGRKALPVSVQKAPDLGMRHSYNISFKSDIIYYTCHISDIVFNPIEHDNDDAFIIASSDCPDGGLLAETFRTATCSCDPNSPFVR